MRALPLVVFSHLRWNFVFQRPQHLMTRFGRTRDVLFIEEPLPLDGAAPGIEFREVAPGVTVCTPRTAATEHGFCAAQYPHLAPMIRDAIRTRAGSRYDLWFYTPMALPIAEALTPRTVIYDCMDELSAFQFAPDGMLDLEQRLLERADVVFTGGPSLYRAKRDRHANCHCFSSSVDAEYFGRAASGAVADHDAQAAIPRPRLGFYGVIDERFDRELLDGVARLRPDYQFVMVGPIAKIAPEELPNRPNIHFLGRQSYADLPAFLAGWDVALLPFAKNDSTRFISPTKTIEYMAAGKPIVSTTIADVAEPYGAMVQLADDAEAFALACDRALRETDAEAGRRSTQFADVLAKTSWDRTAAAMAQEIEKAAHKPANRIVGYGEAHPPVVVIGAGPTGLSAAYHLGDDALLLEAEERVGGWCRSIEDGGFTFDFAGHIMFSNDPYVHEMYKLLLGDNVHWQDREAWIYSKAVYTRYPFQGSLYGLPPAVIKECVVGAIEARFGSTKPAPAAAKPATAAIANKVAKVAPNALCPPVPGGDPKDGAIGDCCADGIAESTVPLAEAKAPAAASGEPKNFEEFIYKVWGAGIAKHFAIPYNRKIWAVPLDEMETSWLGGRVPLPDLEEMIDGALSPKPKPMGPNARFGYPLRGGFQALMDGFLPHLKGRVRLGTRVQAISPGKRSITLTDGTTLRYQSLLSTMPLPALIRAMGNEVPEAVRAAARGLRHTSVRCVNLGIGRENLTEKHWIYYPEDSVFHRIFVQGNASPHCNPAGGFGITCEITYGPLKPLPCDGEDLIRLCIADAIRVGLIRADDPVIVANQVDMPYAYVVYDHARVHNVAVIRDWLENHEIHLAGRYSEWEYYNSDHAFLAGRKAAEKIRVKAAGKTVSL